jgi:phosphocarrier protein
MSGCTEAPLLDIRKIIIRNARGLHARASAKFVSVAEKFDTEILVSKEGTEVVGTSIMGLMMLAAAKGEEITLKGAGDLGRDALDALEKLIEEKFGED